MFYFFILVCPNMLLWFYINSLLYGLEKLSDSSCDFLVYSTVYSKIINTNGIMIGYVKLRNKNIEQKYSHK